MRLLTQEAEELLKLAIRELGQQSEYAGFTKEGTLILSERIANLDNNKPEKIDAQHIAEAVQYGGNINVYIGRELNNFILSCEQMNIILPALVEKQLEKSKFCYDRIKEVFGIYIKPIILEEIRLINLGKYGKKLTSWNKKLLYKQVNKLFVKEV
jgi:hypothetical protein